MKEKMVSVIIPTYNRENTIRRSIDSVLRQTYKNLELIIVDDCSTDKTFDIVNQVNDCRVKYIRLVKNSGACEARNVGIKNANGDYIAFQDSDDEWLENKLETQIKIMELNDLEVSFCNFFKIDEKFGEKYEFPKDIPEGFVSKEILLKKSIVSTQCIMAKKECFDTIKFDVNLPRLQDWDIIIELAKKFRIYHINKCLVNMYVQSNSISKFPHKGIKAMEILWKKNQVYLEDNKDIKRMWYIYLGNYKLSNAENPYYEYKKALAIKFSKDIFIKLIFAKIGILYKLYKIMGKL